jgi:hypothetical protein
LCQYRPNASQQKHRYSITREREHGGRNLQAGQKKAEMTTTFRTHFTFRVDTWTSDGESIVEHIAGVEDYQVALATLRAACERRPGTLGR